MHRKDSVFWKNDCMQQISVVLTRSPNVFPWLSEVAKLVSPYFPCERTRAQKRRDKSPTRSHPPSAHENHSLPNYISLEAIRTLL